MHKKNSLIIPVCNSSAFLHKTLKAVDDQRKKSNWGLEFVLVDDRSPDRNFKVIEKFSHNYPHIKAINLSRNFRPSAVKTGLSYATDDYINIIGDRERSGRVKGESWNSQKKLIKIAKDGIFSLSSLPFQVISISCNIGLLISILLTILTLIRYLANEIEVPGYTTILMIGLGLIGEYIYRIYNEVRNSAYTIVEKTINV